MKHDIDQHVELLPADIRIEWDSIKDQLAEVSEKARADWRPEDMYVMCVNGEAHLYRAGDSWAIVQLTENRFSKERELFIAAAYGEGQRHMEAMEELARYVGAAYIEILSPRRGFERTGWTLENVCYRRRV